VTKPDGTTYKRGLKSDFPTLYTEIHSHPMTAEDYKAAHREEKFRVQQWAKLALLDFSKRMPKGVEFACVLHLDEGHVHIHILAVNMADPKMSANKLHAGKVAAEEWRRTHGQAETLAGVPKPAPQDRPNKPKRPKPSKTPATQKKRDAAHAAALAEWEGKCALVQADNTAALDQWRSQNNAHLRKLRKDRKGKPGDVEAYEAALVVFQDRYFEMVGKKCGLLRNGPGTERLSAMQYHARKKHARLMANEEAAMQAKVAQQGGERAQIIADAATVAADKVALTHQQAELNAEEQALAEREAEIERQEAALRAAEDSWKNREQALAEATLALKQREVTVAEKERILQNERSELSAHKLALDKEMSDRTTELEAREVLVAAQQSEVMGAAAAIEDMVNQFAAGSLTIESGKLKFGRHHPFLQRAATTTPEKRSPMQRIVARFVGALKHAATALSGGATPSFEQEDRPGM
jgi:uncharacterized protein YhaN